MDLRERFDRLDRAITAWMADHGVTLLRLSIGFVFVWFGALKFVPGLSPADQIATDTSLVLTFGLLSEDAARIGLALLEVTIGIGLLTGRFLRVTLLLLFAQMAGTLTPLIIFPERIWTDFPFALTLEGQYIFKNAVLISAGFVIGATVRGGRLVDEPGPAEQRS
ncbi:MAG: DoxX family protein [Acidimicrobiia bacterium]